MPNANIVYDTPMVDYGIVLSYYVYGVSLWKVYLTFTRAKLINEKSDFCVVNTIESCML